MHVCLCLHNPKWLTTSWLHSALLMGILYHIKGIMFSKLHARHEIALYSFIIYCMLSKLFNVMSLLNCGDGLRDHPLWVLPPLYLLQITINSSNAQPLGQQLVAFTSRAAHFTDVMDVIFVTHLVERLTRLMEKRRDVRMSTHTATTSSHQEQDRHVFWNLNLFLC